MADAEVIQLGSRGPAGRGSRSTPSAAARGLAGASGASRPRPGRPADPGRARAGRASARADTPDLTAVPDQPSTEPSTEPSSEPPVGESAPAGRSSGRSSGRRRAARTRGRRPDAGEVPPCPAAGAGQEEAAGAHRHPGGADSHRRPEPSSLVSGVAELLGGMLDLLRQAPVELVRDAAADPLRTLAAVAEAAGVDWQAGVEEIADFARSRFSGDYAVDAFGFDPEFTERVFLPLLRPLVHSWFRVEVQGIENLPTTGPALLVSNHAGTLPLDGMVLHAVIHDEIGRHVRMLGADLIFSTPYSHDLARRIGCTLACQEDAERLLAGGELVSVFPEGFKGLGKPFSDRYKLQRFGRGGFVSAAVRAQVPIVPISIVGSEEIYPLVATAPSLARALGWPYVPITPLFPWFGLLGAIPLPSKWIIRIGEQIATDELPAGAADDPMITFNVTDQVRETIQQTLYALLMQRPHPFR
ncbi:1-acyl-sn-glycerol-3-phosphate acyltransferase [Friedmanniella endophytica]|uniref:1-acyl-sn-glycerol-3-phosphate acyltransferase n=1 Tax=Microlunatus kandeliicorticis TaxID=1759536 RepID=A0A7W3IPC3_9ACTN|nr:lysophospholipid acyltransferase family protein [Microlunatus kandeliicorticis]MBA8792754.1 1-acyl-sn-glycerol-3-phosphate acyltransferase [Microlunatus kandeliicorticis]